MVRVRVLGGRFSGPRWPRRSAAAAVDGRLRTDAPLTFHPPTRPEELQRRKHEETVQPHAAAGQPEPGEVGVLVSARTLADCCHVFTRLLLTPFHGRKGWAALLA